MEVAALLLLLLLLLLEVANERVDVFGLLCPWREWVDVGAGGGWRIV
jgi:hypothetical protein